MLERISSCNFGTRYFIIAGKMKVVYLLEPGASHQSPGCLYFCVRPIFVPGTAGGVIT